MRYKCVTVWHKLSDGTYKKMYFEHSHITKIEKDIILGSQITQNNSMRVRMYCINPCGVSVGDRLTDSYSKKDVPPDNAYTITELKENFDASLRLRHYRAECI